MPSGNAQFALIDQPQETLRCMKIAEQWKDRSKTAELPAARSSLSKQIVAWHEQIVFGDLEGDFGQSMMSPFSR
jgi:hypothetical protein